MLIACSPDRSRFEFDVEIRWVDTAARLPESLDELGVPLRCFHPDRGYFQACYLPEQGWYWNSGPLGARPARWAPPLHRTRRSAVGRRALAGPGALTTRQQRPAVS